MWKVESEGSQVSKKILQERDLLEHQIWWNTRNGLAFLA